MDTPAAVDPAAKSAPLQPDVPPLAATDVAATASQAKAPAEAKAVAESTPAPVDDAKSVVPPKPVANGKTVAEAAPIADNGQMAELKALIAEAAHAGAHARPLLAEKVSAAMAGPIGELAQKVGKPYNLTININLTGQGAGLSS